MSTPFDTSFLVECPDSEDRYRDWVQRYPHGFIINAYREPAGKTHNAMMWHRADCDHIDPKFAVSEPPFRYVTSYMLKACSANPAALAVWAKSREEPLTYCPDCYWKWQKELPSVS